MSAFDSGMDNQYAHRNTPAVNTDRGFSLCGGCVSGCVRWAAFAVAGCGAVSRLRRTAAGSGREGRGWASRSRPGWVGGWAALAAGGLFAVRRPGGLLGFGRFSGSSFRLPPPRGRPLLVRPLPAPRLSGGRARRNRRLLLVFWLGFTRPPVPGLPDRSRWVAELSEAASVLFQPVSFE